MMTPALNVIVSGAVRQGGHHLINAPATVESAIQAAGGLMTTDRMHPSGIITVRRPLGNRKVDVWQWNMTEMGSGDWKNFVLQTGDAVIVQWAFHLEEHEESSTV